MGKKRNYRKEKRNRRKNAIKNMKRKKRVRVIKKHINKVTCLFSGLKIRSEEKYKLGDIMKSLRIF